VVVLIDPVLLMEDQAVVRLAAQHRLRLTAESRQYVTRGGLMSYGPSYLALIHQTVRYVDRILKGARPADLPVEQPTRFELAVNLRTARALGLTLPPSLLLRADHVIE
jgi:putative ABC transport system substrate-binding protein